jgi:hypothetical protein
LCSSAFAVPNTLRFYGAVDVTFDVVKNGTSNHVEVRKAPTGQVEKEIEKILAWLLYLLGRAECPK